MFFKAKKVTDFGECWDFCPCDGNRAVSVLAVRDPEGDLVVRTKGAALYKVETSVG